MKKNAEKVSLIIDVTGAMMKGPGKWDEDAIYKKLKDIGIGGEIRKLAPSLTSAKPGVKGNKKTEAVDKFLWTMVMNLHGMLLLQLGERASIPLLSNRTCCRHFGWNQIKMWMQKM